MTLPLRPRAVPQCSACIRSYAFGGFIEPAMGAMGLAQQVRGKKKVAVVSSTVPVRLLKDVKAFGRRGAIVPISLGKMRNEWFPRRIAEYMTGPERRDLKQKGTTFERDFAFDAEEISLAAAARQASGHSQPGMMSNDMIASMSTPRRAPEVEKVTPERSMQLLDIFVPQRLDFYRQPIVEEVREPEPEPEKPRRQRSVGTGAAAELYAARLQADVPEPKPKEVKAQAIYGSVSTHDVLNAVRAAMGNNDESARVMVAEEDIKFFDVGSSAAAAEESGKVVKHVGDFTVEIRVKGAEESIRRLVKVNAQEA